MKAANKIYSLRQILLWNTCTTWCEERDRGNDDSRGDDDSRGNDESIVAAIETKEEQERHAWLNYSLTPPFYIYKLRFPITQQQWKIKKLYYNYTLALKKTGSSRGKTSRKHGIRKLPKVAKWGSGERLYGSNREQFPVLRWEWWVLLRVCNP